MRFSELEGARVGAWGAGREIRALRRAMGEHLSATPLRVVATDEPLAEADREPFDGARFVAGGEIVEALAGCDVVVRSPGVSIYRDEIQHLLHRGVTVTTGTALWLAEVRDRSVIGVTGTKGKSTTASLIAHLLGAAGCSAQLAGNVGRPAIELLDVEAPDHYVIELSSYQIADLAAGPRTAVFTNLYREHLDWHRTEDAYRRDKLRLAALPEVETVIANGADELLTAGLRGLGVEPVTYGTPQGCHVEGDVVVAGDAQVVLDGETLRGRHNGLNLCAAITAVAAVGVAVPPLPDALAGFRMPPHRLETVAEAGGVLWVDDSISTTPESTLAALASFPGRRLVLIAGGYDRDQDYGALAQEVARREATVLGLPVTGSRLVDAVRGAGHADATPVPDLDAAVATAARDARPGDVVLLSPAAPSFGAYTSFEERGDHFRALVDQLGLRRSVPAAPSGAATRRWSRAARRSR